MGILELIIIIIIIIIVSVIRRLEVRLNVAKPTYGLNRPNPRL